MNLNGAGPPGPHFVKKLEPMEDRGGGKDIKPVRTTLNRVPRSSEAVSVFDIPTDLSLSLFSRCLREFPGICTRFAVTLTSSPAQNACRKQKMRCEGAENPPCKRCRQQSLECLFEKPNREASLTGEAGLECVLYFPSSVSRSFIVLGGYGAWRHTLRIYGSLKQPSKIAWWKSLTTCARGQQAQSAPLPLSLLHTYILLRMSMRIHLGLCRRPSPRARHLTLVILLSCPLPNQAQQCVPLHLSPV